MASDHVPDEVTGIPGQSPARSCKSAMAAEEVSAQTKNRKQFSCVLCIHFNHKSLPYDYLPNHHCSDFWLQYLKLQSKPELDHLGFAKWFFI